MLCFGGTTKQASSLTLGAGFYLNATTEKWKKHYNMYDLVVEEIPAVLKEANLGLVSCGFGIVRRIAYSRISPVSQSWATRWEVS